MKKLIILSFILLSVSSPLSGYTADNDPYKSISENIVESYNKGDSKAFSKYFNKEVNGSLSEDKINGLIQSLKSELGNIKSIKSSKKVSDNSFLYTLEFEKGNLDLILAFDKDNKISGILFQSPQPEIKYPEINKNTTIEEIVNPYITQKDNMGLAVGIIDNNQSKEYFFGKTAKNKGKPDKNTLFEIGSITKVFTTTALAKMVVDKKVNLNDNLDKFISSPNYNGKKIKLVDLATHRSSLPKVPDDMFKDIADPLNPYANYSKEQMYKFIKEYKLNRAPGTSYDYSNLGMGVLGDVLAGLEKKDYNTFITDKIFKPLKMNNTTLSPSRLQLKNSAIGHYVGEPVIMWDFASMAGAGAIKSDITDMLKFLKANIDLKNSSLKDAMILAHKPINKEAGFQMGLGWHISQLNNDSIIWHNGATGGFTSFLGFSKNKNKGVVVLSNSNMSVDTLSMLILKKLELE